MTKYTALCALVFAFACSSQNGGVGSREAPASVAQALSGDTTLDYASASTTADTDAGDKTGGFDVLNSVGSSCTVGSYADCWDDYIEFSPGYTGYFTFNLASIGGASVSPADVTDLKVVTKFQGGTTPDDYWQWQLYDVNAGQWDTVATSQGFGDWVWSSEQTFARPAGTTPQQFVASNGDIEVRLQEVTGDDAMELDTLRLEVLWDGGSTGNTLVVAKSGGDYSTIQAALNAAMPGDTVAVRAGVYNESLSFPRSGSSSGGYITLSGDPGAIIDGTGAGAVGVDISSRSYVKVTGFDIRNFSGTDPTPEGINVDGSSSFVEIRNNTVESIESSQDAHGIAVYGDSATPASNLVIDGNEIKNCTLGSSESLVLNGNVTDFVVSNNTIHDNDNIGIDFVGFEQTGPSGSDQARNGVCTHNVVYAITSDGNPAYGGSLAADGIYVDGARDIVIDGNEVHDCDIGIEVGDEHAGTSASNVTVRNNFVSGSYQANILMGGYDPSVGSVENVVVVNNTTYQGGENGSGEIELQFQTNGATIENNICYGRAGNDYLIDDDAGAGDSNVDVSVDDNLYFGASTSSPGSFADPDAHFVNPLLVSAPSDLHLQSGSPAIDAGLDLGTDAQGEPISGATDVDGEARVQGSAIDIGADEH